MVDIDQLVKEKERIQGLINKHEIKLLRVKRMINENCTHQKTRNATYNVEGGYLNVAEYHEILICEICEKELDRKISYGSFA